MSFAVKGDLVAKQAFLAGRFEAWRDRVPADAIVAGIVGDVAIDHAFQIARKLQPRRATGERAHPGQARGEQLFDVVVEADASVPCNRWARTFEELGEADARPTTQGSLTQAGAGACSVPVGDELGPVRLRPLLGQPQRTCPGPTRRCNG